MMPPAHSSMGPGIHQAAHLRRCAPQGDHRRRKPEGFYVYTMPALLNEYLGTKFKIVAGYQGIASVYLALERRRGR